jgi:hypothetical protein
LFQDLLANDEDEFEAAFILSASPTRDAEMNSA